ncbi:MULTISPECIES: hypothetical protein [Flavobacteriaceae]|uniref:hypothetical protein n=1 Tax=Flavobacteriaceae TaxID=49546 RepID=UPI0010AED08A|nr:MULTISPECIES: hypothetical protein [Flavobacteriaceae]NJB38103.1 hypothetical protein [Croceivirga sp. JEA036]TKD59016.1 hypothetical protein FBT53_14625 [Flavobacterium sp. ASW18X]
MSYKNHHLRTWFVEHPCISLQCVEKLANVPKDTIRLFVKEHRESLPQKHFKSIIEVVSHYGYIPMDDE